MSQIVLADEINRATPKTQSALLECMEERQVDDRRRSAYPMPDPFLVIATQNPIEYEGTFALPEAQLDRFMLRLRMGYPTATGGDRHPRRAETGPSARRARRGAARWRSCGRCRSAVREIYVDTSVSEYIVRLVNATRTPPRRLPWGLAARQHRPLPGRAGPRGPPGRDYVIPDDVEDPRGARRWPTASSSRRARRSARSTPRPIVRELLETVPVDAPVSSEPVPRRHRVRGLPGPLGPARRSPRPCEFLRRLPFLVLATILGRRGPQHGLRLPLLPGLPRRLVVLGGSYLVTRLGLTDLEAGYSVNQLQAHVGEILPARRTRSGAPSRLPKLWLEVHNPSTLPVPIPGRAISPGSRRRALLGREGARSADAATSASTRSRSGPATRSASSRQARRSAMG